jgi:rod shape determining protein RodA
VVGIFFFHIAVNICMSIGLFPVVGIPLPLISYGGSSLLTFSALLFILLRLDADRQMVLR